MYIKLHSSETGRTLVAACDENLLGKTIVGEKTQITVSDYFYKGEKKSREEAIPIFKNASDLNIIGAETTTLAIELGLLTKENILMIATTPHAVIISL